MAGGKRASMREGPLAALFRGTAELEAEEKAERDRGETAQREATARAEPPGREAPQGEAPERAERAWRESPPEVVEQEEEEVHAEPVVERPEPRVPSPQE